MESIEAYWYGAVCGVVITYIAIKIIHPKVKEAIKWATTMKRKNKSLAK